MPHLFHSPRFQVCAGLLVVAVASIGSPDEDGELLVAPIEGGELAIGYDMRPEHARRGA